MGLTTEDRPCKQAWALRAKWYESQDEKDKLSYQRHLKTCPHCRLRIIRNKRMAEKIEYDEELWNGQFEEKSNME